MSRHDDGIGAVLNSTATQTNVTSGVEAAINPADNRLGVLVSCIGFGSDTDYVTLKIGNTGGQIFFILNKGTPAIYLHMKYFGKLVKGLMTITIGAGTVSVVVTEFTYGAPGGGGNIIYLPDDALPKV